MDGVKMDKMGARCEIEIFFLFFLTPGGWNAPNADAQCDGWQWRFKCLQKRCNSIGGRIKKDFSPSPPEKKSVLQMFRGTYSTIRIVVQMEIDGAIEQRCGVIKSNGRAIFSQTLNETRRPTSSYFEMRCGFLQKKVP